MVIPLTETGTAHIPAVQIIADTIIIPVVIPIDQILTITRIVTPTTAIDHTIPTVAEVITLRVAITAIDLMVVGIPVEATPVAVEPVDVIDKIKI